jgi:hypothetical protein
MKQVLYPKHMDSGRREKCLPKTLIFHTNTRDSFQNYFFIHMQKASIEL